MSVEKYFDPAMQMYMTYQRLLPFLSWIIDASMVKYASERVAVIGTHPDDHVYPWRYPLYHYRVLVARVNLLAKTRKYSHCHDVSTTIHKVILKLKWMRIGSSECRSMADSVHEHVKCNEGVCPLTNKLCMSEGRGIITCWMISNLRIRKFESRNIDAEQVVHLNVLQRHYVAIIDICC